MHEPDGTVSELDGGNVMIHPSLDRKRATRRAPIPPRATLLLYTDGLVERRTRHVNVGIADTARVLAGHSARPLHTLANEVAGRWHEDDIALVAVRVRADQPSLPGARRAGRLWSFPSP